MEQIGTPSAEASPRTGSQHARRPHSANAKLSGSSSMPSRMPKAFGWSLPARARHTSAESAGSSPQKPPGAQPGAPVLNPALPRRSTRRASAISHQPAQTSLQPAPASLGLRGNQRNWPEGISLGHRGNQRNWPEGISLGHRGNQCWALCRLEYRHGGGGGGGGASLYRSAVQGGVGIGGGRARPRRSARLDV